MEMCNDSENILLKYLKIIMDMINFLIAYCN